MTPGGGGYIGAYKTPEAGGRDHPWSGHHPKGVAGMATPSSLHQWGALHSRRSLS